MCSQVCGKSLKKRGVCYRGNFSTHMGLNFKQSGMGRMFKCPNNDNVATDLYGLLTYPTTKIVTKYVIS